MRPDHTVPYRIERTRNRHSRAVLRDDTIVIRLARGLSTVEEREHVENLLRRMTKHVVRERDRTPIDPFRALLATGERTTVALPSGRSYVFELVPGKRSRARRTPDGWRIDVGLRLRRRPLHRFLWALLAEAELPHVQALVLAINDRTYRARLRSVRLRFMTSQWGSCSSHGDITLSTSLLFVPPALLHYVIVHELAHTRHRNHSARYWRTVEEFLPSYAEARRELRKFRINSL